LIDKYAVIRTLRCITTILRPTITIIIETLLSASASLDGCAALCWAEFVALQAQCE
jgi:hypothetical protein